MDKMGTMWRTTLSAVRLRSREWRDKLEHQMRQMRAGAPPASEPEPEVPATAPEPAPGSALYKHSPHTHQPRNVNHVHHKEQEASGFNTRVAVWLTKNVGTMQCAYLFAAIGIGSLVGLATNSMVLAAVCGALSSYFLQLVLLPILSVGQNVLGRHAELQSDETFKTSQRSFHDIVEIMAHLSAQDEELLKQTKLLVQLCGVPAPEVEAAGTAGSTEPPAPPAPPARSRKSRPLRSD